MLPDNITDDLENDEQVISQSFIMFPSSGQTLYLDGITLEEMCELYEDRLETGMWSDVFRHIISDWADEHPDTVTLIETRDPDEQHPTDEELV